MTDRFPSYSSAPWQPSPPPPPRRGRPTGSDALAIVLAVVIVVLFVAGGVGVAVNATSENHSSVSLHLGSGSPPGSRTGPGSGNGSTSTVPSSSSTTAPTPVSPVSPLSVPPVTAPPVSARPLNLSPSVIAGIVNPAAVDVDTRLGYQNAIAAGTGMILTSNGVVLTNNHVIDGATTVSAVSIGSGRSYTARVLGVDPTADVAVIQLEGASGLPTVAISTSPAQPGDPVVAIGNAGGAGGAPSVTTGTVEALDQSIIANDPAEGTSEQLNGLIETNASLQPGDSGGPLVNGRGEVIGMDTAASEANQSTSSMSFAIPISQAIAVAHQIEAGQASSTVHLGLPPFLGVTVTTGSGPGGRAGALVSTVIAGGPAAAAGLSAGELIVAVNGGDIDSSPALTATLRQYRPGNTVSVTWIDRVGASHKASVLLGTGPAD